MERDLRPLDCGAEIALKAKAREKFQAFQAFRRIRSEIETQSLFEGLRSCAYLLIPELRLASFLMSLEDKGFQYQIVLRTAFQKGFLHAYKPPRDDRENLVGVAVSKDKEKAVLLKKAFLNSDHWTVGELLGYPECCVRKFIQRGVLDAGREELQFEVVPYETTQLFKYWGASLVLHFPCHPFCERSLDMGRTYKDLAPREGLLFMLEQQTIEVKVLESGLMIVDAPDFLGAATTIPGTTLEVRVNLL